MSAILRQVLARIRAVARRDAADQELAQEIETHLALAEERFIRRGMTPASARRAARIEFGGVTQLSEAHRRTREMPLTTRLSALAWDLRHSAHALIRSPGYTLTTVAIFALTIGISTAVFAAVEAVLLRSLPYRSPEKLVSIAFSSTATTTATRVPSPVLLAWMAQSRTMDSMGAFETGQTTFVTPDGEPISLVGASVSTGFFPTLGDDPLYAGHLFAAEAYGSTANPVAILTRRFATQRFGAAESALGSTIRLSFRNYEIVGIISDAFRLPASVQPDVYFPLDLRAGSGVSVSTQVVGRIAGSTSRADVADELKAIGLRSAIHYPPVVAKGVSDDMRIHVVPLRDHIAGDARGILWTAFGAVACILLIACANVAGLTMSRIAGQQRELSMRVALGATRGRLLQWLLVECLILVVVGAIVSVLVLVGTLTEFRNLLRQVVPDVESVRVNWSVLGFSALCIVLTTVLSSLIPAVSLRRHMRLTAQGASPNRSPRPWRSVLVSGQVALAFTLVLGGLVLSVALSRLTSSHTGFDQRQLLTFKVAGTGMGAGAGRVQRLNLLLERVKRLPGVAGVAASTTFPLAGHAFGFDIAIKGSTRAFSPATSTGVDVISPGYFQTLATRVSGREFTFSDVDSAPAVAVVNRRFADLHFQGQEPIGATIGLGGSPDQANTTIVGVADDVLDGSLDQMPAPTVYRPFPQAAPQMGWHTATVLVRTVSDPLPLLGTVRNAVAEVIPRGAVYDFSTMEDRIAATVLPERTRAVTFSALGAIALLLAAVGLYGLLDTAVAHSRKEFGVRLALGATRSSIVALVARRAALSAGLGLIMGSLLGVLFERILASQLTGIVALGAPTFIYAALIMVVTSIAAISGPLHRVFRIDPINAIRTD